MTSLYLIRHGQAIGNVTPIFSGMRGDKGLTPLGIQQAQQLHNRLQASGEIKADVLISSTLLRARQTAAIIAPALGLEVDLDDDMQELIVGECDGMTFDEYASAYGRPVSFDLSTPLSPHGETWETFTARVTAALARIVDKHVGQTIVVVCHGGVIEVVFAHLLGLPPAQLPATNLQVTNTSINHWQYLDKRGRTFWRLVRYNDDLHIRSALQWQQAASAIENS